jgi:PAS domain S-box-containing protein
MGEDLQRRLMDDYLRDINAIIFVRDAQGYYLMVNGAFTRTVGLTQGEILGKSDAELWPDRADTYEVNDTVIWETQKSVVYQETGITADGVERLYMVFKFPLVKSGYMYAVGGLGVDITEVNRDLKELLGLTGRLVASLEQSQNMLRALQFVLPK